MLLMLTDNKGAAASTYRGEYLPEPHHLGNMGDPLSYAGMDATICILLRRASLRSWASEISSTGNRWDMYARAGRQRRLCRR